MAESENQYIKKVKLTPLEQANLNLIQKKIAENDRPALRPNYWYDMLIKFWETKAQEGA